MFYSANTLKVGTEESFDEKKDVIYMSSSTFYSKKPLSLSGTYFTLQAGFFFQYKHIVLVHINFNRCTINTFSAFRLDGERDRDRLTYNLLFLSVRLEKRKINNFLMNQTLMTRRNKVGKAMQIFFKTNCRFKLTQAAVCAHCKAWQRHGK